MATILTQGDVITVRLEYKHGNSEDRYYNLLHYSLIDVSVPGGGLWPGESMAVAGPEIADGMYAALYPTWASTAADSMRMTGCTVQNIWPTPISRQYTFTPAGDEGSGAIDSEAIPLQDAVTLIKQGESSSRKDLGRIFVPGCPELGQSAGVLTEAQEALYKTMAAAWSNQIPLVVFGNTLTFRQILFNPKELPEPVKRVVTEVVLSNTLLKTQRRRRPGKGI